MKNMLLKTLAMSVLFVGGMSLANADEPTLSKAEMNAQVKSCAKKKEGDWATYAYRGITFNGICQPNASGKLQFKAPAP